eukprot:TRINITY_DN8956_c0_g1_i5.p1 TRINITY_DN8956_c0_g1~~TRINITY_DN8956_c0_g1_i5.p1  ORF type:complete len:476 (-),score=69.13 TRINITY_DN8956_c0_g1_i5:534-1766(-)
MGKMQANRFSENQENMQNQESPKLPMWQSNQMDESVQCTPVTTGKRPVKGVHQDDDSDEDSPPQKPLKKLRTDWEMVTQTQTNDVNYNKLQDADMECLNIFQLDYAELRIRWNQLPDQLAKFRLERVMEVQFKQIRRIVEGRSCIVEEVIGRLDGVRYAVKHYKPDTTYMRQFVREVQALALVADHPNITTYYQAWIEKDVLKKGYRGYIQLKLCKESLTQFLKNNGGKLSEAVATQLMSSGQTLGVKAQRFRGHTSPHRNVKEKVKVAKQELIHEFDLKQTEFDNIKQQMQEICSDILETKNNAASSSKRKNQNSGNTPSVKKQKRVGEDDEEGGDDENLPSHCINKKALKERKYEEWKENTISNALKLNLVEQNSRKKKQSTITSFMKTLQQVEPIEDNDTDNEQNLR